MSVRKGFFLLFSLQLTHLFVCSDTPNLRCPPKRQLCNDVCLDSTNEHKTPCGSSKKCLSANFPFYCNLTNTCIGPGDICGDQCWRGGMERYNCNGTCITYKDTCNGACDHPDHIVWNVKPLKLMKCGAKCIIPPKGFTYHYSDPDPLAGYHDCGEECLPLHIPCNGVCPNMTLIDGWGQATNATQWKCGNECMPRYKKFQNWKECPDGTCRGVTVSCEGPLPGSCPADQLLCKHVPQKGEFSCKSKSEYYHCNATTRRYGTNCYRYSEPCNSECHPGYRDCGGYCKLEKEYIKCDGRCHKTKDKHVCDGKCMHTSLMCNGRCAEGFVKCGDRCIMSTETDCNGECSTLSKPCNGQCLRADWVKVMDTDPDDLTDKVVCKDKSDEFFAKEVTYECNGVLHKTIHPCNGTCSTLDQFGTVTERTLIGGQCLNQYEHWECNGSLISRYNHCNGDCYYDFEAPCGTICIDKNEVERSRGSFWGRRGPYLTHCDSCLRFNSTKLRTSCNGGCSNGRVSCGSECLRDYYEIERKRTCGDKCIDKELPCNGECPEDYPYKCTNGIGGSRHEVCLKLDQLGDGQEHCEDGSDEKECVSMRKCNGKMLCVNKPCHHKDPENEVEDSQTVCQASVNITRWESGSWETKERKPRMYYCPEEDFCKLEGIPCNGDCMTNLPDSAIKPEDQFACLDGSKCIDKHKLCKGRTYCSDRSDDNHESCKSKCPLNWKGQPEHAWCKDGTQVCADVPCNNSELINGNFDSARKEWSSRGVDYDFDIVGLDELTCENWRFELCTGGEGGPKCVKKAIDGNEKEWAEVGETCNGKCLSGVKCGNECLPKIDGSSPACNESCDHIDSAEPLTKCSKYCLTEEAMSRPWKVKLEENSSFFKRRGVVINYRSLKCDDECRLPTTEEEYVESKRKPCNGSCFFGYQKFRSQTDPHQVWVLCDSGDQCFPPEEWCNGVKDCEDGTDEARCDLCPKIKECICRNPPANHTASNSNNFPRYVCEDEPCCGECSKPGKNSDPRSSRYEYEYRDEDSDEDSEPPRPDTYACGNECLPTSEICSLSGECVDQVMFKCDKCLEVDDVCDGKNDCNDGSDEENCEDHSGSWMCNGVRQPKSKPCKTSIEGDDGDAGWRWVRNG